MLFPEKDGDAFEDELLETLGKLDSVYLETVGEKEDNENGKDNIEDVFDSKIMGPDGRCLITGSGEGQGNISVSDG